MKVAIPLFGSRVSPRFDYARSIMIVTAEDGKVIDKKEIPSEGWGSFKRIRELSKLGVDTLICGAIDEFSAMQLLNHKIKVFSWVTGEAEDGIKLLLNGQLASGLIMCPGGRRKRWQFCGGRGRRGRGPW